MHPEVEQVSQNEHFWKLIFLVQVHKVQILWQKMGQEKL